MNHIMVDIETMGTGSNTVIAAIGAVQFDPYNDKFEGNQFYTNVDIQSCLNVGLKVTGSTIEWWMKQNQEAREALFTDKALIRVALWKLNDFIRDIDDKGNVHMWGRSPRFDVGILHDAYRATDVDVSWDFRKELDVRTIEWLNPSIKAKYDTIRDSSNLHKAVDDCNHQIRYVQSILRTNSVLSVLR